MNRLFLLIILCVEFLGCNNNDNTNSLQPVRVNDGLIHNVNKNPVYIPVKREYQRDGKWDDTTLRVGHANVGVSISKTCQGNYVILDTTCAYDTCWIGMYRDAVLHIKIKSLKEHNITIDKNYLRVNFKELDLSNALIDMTSIDSVDDRNVFFSTFISKSGDCGMLVYSINLNGDLKLIHKEMVPQVH